MEQEKSTVREKPSSLTRMVAFGAVSAALVLAATMIHVPIPGFRIYCNLGEGVIYTVALLLGGRHGAFAGAIGAGMADIVLGYPLWAPLTALIKGTEGYVVGTLGRKALLPGLCAGAAVMITGYTLAAGLLYGWKAAPVELLTDMVQTGIGIGCALLLVPAIRRKFAPGKAVSNS